MAGKTKAQAAFEFLMTYGWAILTIAIILATLYYLGVFRTTTFVRPTCALEPGFSCYSFKFVEGAKGLELDFGQAKGTSIRVTAMGCSKGDSPVMTELDNPITIPSGEHRFIAGGDSGNIVTCTDENGEDLPLSETKPGTPFKGKIWVAYTEVETGTNRVVSGEITGTFADDPELICDYDGVCDPGENCCCPDPCLRLPEWRCWNNTCVILPHPWK